MKEKQVNPGKIQMRKAIAMIELIFAIVIMGIVLMSIPNLINQATESGYTTIQQESIAAAASDLSLILAREWDESGTDSSIGSPILDTASPTTSLEDDRPGARSRSYATGIGGSARTASSIGHDSNDTDDIDDADGITGKVTRVDGYQDLIDISIEVTTDINYITDTTSSGTWDTSSSLTFDKPFTRTTSKTATKNIKTVSIRLESTSGEDELKKNIVFNAFSCNIGSYKLERRELP